jgi:LuxR family maltose regulon positive regulatory protein
MNGNNESLAKIARPRHRNVYRRTSLFDKLDIARDTSSVWISAPPGSGKTTLISSYLREKNSTSIWYHVDENDLDIATFFWYMRLAVRKILPRQYSQLPAYTSAYHGGLSAFSLRYFEKLFALLPPDFVIVIDDIHVAENNQLLNEVLIQAVAVLPSYGRMVMLSRNPLPAAFCRLLVNESLHMMGWNDLRLTAEEVRGIVSMRKPTLTDDSLELIRVQSDGWVAGLIFGLQDINLDSVSTDINADQYHEILFGYFANEVFAQQDEERRQLLMQMALFPHMTQDMARQLTNSDNAGALLCLLHKNNYFVNLQSLGSPTYQFHPLFRDFLLHRLHQSCEHEELMELQRHAAEILEQNGYREAASKLYQSMAAWGSVVKLIGEDAMEKFRQGRMQNLAAQITKLPHHVTSENPWMLYWLGMCQIFLEPKKAHTVFAAAFERFQAEGNVVGSLSAWAGAVNSLLTEWEDVTKIEEWIDIGEKLMPLRGQAVAAKIGAHATAAMCFSLFLCRPHSPILERFLQKTHALIVDTKDLTFSLMGCNLLLIFYGWQGDLTKSLLLVNSLQSRVGEQSDSDAHRVMWHAAKGWLEIMSGEPQQCLERSVKALSLAREAGVHIFDHKFYGMAAQACLLLGKPSEARVHLQKYTDVAHGKANLVQFHVHFLEGWGSWLRGDTNSAWEHIQLATQLLKIAGSPPIITAKNNIATAMLHFEREEESDGRVCLDAAKRTANMTNSFWLQYQCFLVEATFAINAGSQKDCLSYLRSALQVARQNNLVVTDWWHADTMSRLMELALAHNIEPDYAQHIINTTKLRPGPLSASSDAWPWPLSVEVLGEFQLKIEGKVVTGRISRQRKVLELLKALVVSGPAGVSVARLSDSIWPEAEGDDARNALKTTLHRLRKVLGISDVVQLKNGLLSLHSDYCWSDIENFKALAKTPSSSSERVRNLKKAIELYKGSLLSSDDMPWVITARNKLGKIEHDIVMELGARYESRSRWKKAVRVYLHGFEQDSLDEQVCRHLMICYQRSGRKSDAAATYKYLCDQLERRVARQPSSKTRQLVESILHS